MFDFILHFTISTVEVGNKIKLRWKIVKLRNAEA